MGLEFFLTSDGAENAGNAMQYLPLILDVAVCAFLLIGAIIGCKKGFLKGLVGLIGTVAAVIIAFFFAGALVEFLEGGFQCTTNLSGWFEEKLNGVEGFAVPMSDEGVKTALENLGLPGFLSDMIANVVSGLEIEGSPTIAQVVAPVLAGFLMTAICGIALFIISAILLTVLANLLSGLFDKIPVLGALNHVLGFALGFVKTLIYAYIILGVLSILPFEELQLCLKETHVIAWLYETNLLMLIIQQISALDSVVDYVQNFINGLAGETGEISAASLL